MVTLDVTRVAGESLLESPERIGLTDQTLTVLALGDSPAPIRVTRVAAEVLIRVEPVVRMTGETLTVMALSDDAPALRVTRVAAEVLIDAVPDIKVTQQTLTVLAAGTGSPALRVTRVAGEILVRPTVPPPEPIPLPDGLRWFLHNWVNVPSITTSFMTDVARSETTGSEGRRGLRSKGLRTIQVRLGPVDGVDNVDKLIKHAKRFVRENMVMPIFADALELQTAATSGQNFLTVSTTSLGRWFPGARIVVLRLNALDNTVSDDSQVFTIDHVTPTRIYVTTLLGADIPVEGTCIVPLMDVKLGSQSNLTYPLRGDLAEVNLQLEEVAGDPALPALGIDTLNFHTDGRAIWSYDSNWAENVEVEYRRPGSTESSGRDTSLTPEADREVIVHRYKLANDRERQFPVLRFFEAHLGRLRSFWHIDQECLWTVVGWRTGGNPTFLDLAPLGDFDEFVDKIEETNFVGVVMNDGRRFVREAVTKTSGGSWRITVDEALPTGYTSSDVKHVAVARLSRFDSDSFTEEWEAPVAGQASVDIIELLNEATFSL